MPSERMPQTEPKSRPHERLRQDLSLTPPEGCFAHGLKADSSIFPPRIKHRKRRFGRPSEPILAPVLKVNPKEVSLPGLLAARLASHSPEKKADDRLPPAPRACVTTTTFAGK